MARRVVLVFFLIVFFPFFLFGHVPVRLAGLFSELVIEHEKRPDGTYSLVLALEGAGQFYQKVLKSKKPVVVKFCAAEEPAARRALYHRVARRFQGKVTFVSMNVTANENTVRAIMMQLGIVQVPLPVFLFFRTRTLLLPLVKGVGLSQDLLMKMVHERFFSCKQALSEEKGESFDNDLSMLPDDSVLGKLKKISVKLQDSLPSLHDVSKEVQAYQYAKRWRRHL